MGDTPCEECGKQGDIELKITDEKFYREWNREAYSRLDSGAVVGVFPALKVVAKRPEICKMCHSFSADALDFDLAHIEDSLFVKAFPKMRRELMREQDVMPHLLEGVDMRHAPAILRERRQHLHRAEVRGNEERALPRCDEFTKRAAARVVTHLQTRQAFLERAGVHLVRKRPC